MLAGMLKVNESARKEDLEKLTLAVTSPVKLPSSLVARAASPQASPSLSVASGAGSFLGSLFGFTPTKKRAAIDQPIDQPTSTHKKRRARRTSPILEVDSEAELEDEIQADDEIEEAEEIQDQADDKTWNTMPPAQLVSTLTLAYIESLHDGDVAGAFLACLDANLVAYRGLHVQALIVFARRMGVPCNGGKSDIVRRLKAYADAEE
jgi:hypothetical protein